MQHKFCQKGDFSELAKVLAEGCIDVHFQNAFYADR